MTKLVTQGLLWHVLINHWHVSNNSTVLLLFQLLLEALAYEKEINEGSNYHHNTHKQEAGRHIVRSSCSLLLLSVLVLVLEVVAGGNDLRSDESRS